MAGNTINSLDFAEALEAQFCHATSLLAGVTRVLEEHPMPEAVVWRGHRIALTEAVESLKKAFDDLADAETFIRQHCKNQRFQPAAAKAS